MFAQSYPDQPIANFIGLIGAEKFSDEFFGAANQLVAIDQCTVFISENNNISALVSHASSAAHNKVQMLASSYVSHGYQMDPMWRKSVPAGAATPIVVRPSSLPDDAYRREFYDSVNIFEETAFFGSANGRDIYVGFYRERSKGHFLENEIGKLSSCTQSMISVLAKQADIASRLTVTPPPATLTRAELWKKVNLAILEDAPHLTPREAEICSGIILGYTVVGLSLNLNISVNTVATHRKRAYAKLKISSQNELFMHYFGLVERLNS